MFRSSINCVFFLVIILIFTSTKVFSDCDGEWTCRNSFDDTWCCSYDSTCGSSYLNCDSNSSAPLSPSAISVIIVASILFFVVCLTCCVHSQQRQRLRPNYTNSNNRVSTSPYQQQALRGPVRVVHVRPIYNVGAVSSSRPYPAIHEEPPPSYEVATAALSSSN